MTGTLPKGPVRSRRYGRSSRNRVVVIECARMKHRPQCDRRTRTYGRVLLLPCKVTFLGELHRFCSLR